MNLYKFLLEYIDKKIIFFGFLFALGFVIIEGWFAPDWGTYSLGPLLWHTPLLLIPIWFFIGMFTAGLNKWLAESYSLSSGQSMVIVGATFFLLSLLGEYLGNFLEVWQFHSNKLSLLGVPIWICLSYSLAFSFSPLFYKRFLGGLIQTGLIGLFWQIFYSITEY